MGRKTEKPQRKLMLRLDYEVHRAVKAKAGQLDRSLNWVINDALRSSIMAPVNGAAK